MRRTAAVACSAVHLEDRDVENAVFVHCCSQRYALAKEVVPERDGAALAFWVAWARDSRELHPESERYD